MSQTTNSIDFEQIQAGVDEVDINFFKSKSKNSVSAATTSKTTKTTITITSSKTIKTFKKDTDDGINSLVGTIVATDLQQTQLGGRGTSQKEAESIPPMTVNLRDAKLVGVRNAAAAVPVTATDTNMGQQNTGGVGSGGGGGGDVGSSASSSSTSGVVSVGGSTSNIYKIVKTLGKGNFAKVKLAIHMPTGREVAIKIIDKTSMNTSAQQKLYREVAIMKRLNHPNIVRLYQVIESERTLYLIMEYASRGELFEHLVKNGRMKERDARVIFRQLVSAIQYCHSKFIVHRDLKAENLLLDSRMNVKIADFGFGNTFEPRSYLETFCGSPPYAAPELFMGRKYAGPEADAWSLGVVLYTLVSGTLPFDGGTLKELRERVLRGKYRVPYYISMDCENLMRKFLVLSPSKRTSLLAVMGDKWLNTGYEAAEYMRPYREVPLQLNDQSRIDHLVDMGFKRNDVMNSVKEQRFDDLYCSYMLLGIPLPSSSSASSSSSTTSPPKPNTRQQTSQYSTKQTSDAKRTNVERPAVTHIELQVPTAPPISSSSSTGPPVKPTRRSVCKSPAQSNTTPSTHGTTASKTTTVPTNVVYSPQPAKRQHTASIGVKPTLLSTQRKLVTQQKQQQQHQTTPTKYGNITSGSSGNNTPKRALRPTTLYEKAESMVPPPNVTKHNMDPHIIERLKISNSTGGSSATAPSRQELKKASSTKPFTRNAARATFHFGQGRSKQRSEDSDLGYPPLSADDTKPSGRVSFFTKLTARFGRRTLQLNEKDTPELGKNLSK